MWTAARVVTASAHRPMRLPNYRSDAWIRWTTRNTNSRYTVRYLRNCHRAATYFIQAYLLPADPATRPTFADMTRAMHVLTADHLRTGPPGSTYDADAMHPAQTRAELLRDPRVPRSDIVFDVFVGNAVTKAIGRARSGRLVDARGSILFGGRRYRFQKCFRDGVSRLSLPGVPLAGRSAIVLPKVGEQTVRVVPSHDAAGLERCYQAAAKEMECIVAIEPAHTRRSATQRRLLFRRLARYYRLTVHAHLFLAQNNSMLMNQLNCITFLHFKRACMHYNLDAFACLLSDEVFAELHNTLIADGG